jgi:GTP cyclohydrolase FolE2
MAGVGAALVAIPAVGFISGSYEAAAKGLILNNLDYLKLDEVGLEQFVTDYSKNKTNNYRIKVRSLYLMRSRADQSGIVAQMVYEYLHSTDFFRNKMDEQKPLKYVGMYNPYNMPCANPFSALYYPPQVS